MKKALIRFEDVGPGGPYGTEENLMKLRVVADYLYSEGIPFQVGLIPRFIDPNTKYNKSVADTLDPYISTFNNTLQYMFDRKGNLGFHGYTHQFDGWTVSGSGLEFFSADRSDSSTPPDDQPEAVFYKEAFISSYATSRISQAFQDIEKANIKLAFGFETPHYTSSLTQRGIIESYVGLFFEDPPNSPILTVRKVTILDTDRPFYRGVVYIPLPLGYVDGSDPLKSVNRICNAIKTYTEDDVAAFFYHPALEFPFISITPNGVVYDDNSYLKQLVKCFKQQNFTFVSVYGVVNFIPDARVTGFFPGTENVLFAGDVNGDKIDGFIVWQPATGTWYLAISSFSKFPNRQAGDLKIDLALTNWAIGTKWKPFVGDFNGDGKDDIVVWDSDAGDWQVALSNGQNLIPQGTWLKPWAVGKNWVPLVGDFNGDGLDDLLVWLPQTGEWQVALSLGDKFMPAGIWLNSFAVGTNFISKTGDFNGDKIDDIVSWNPLTGEWQVALSDGSKFVPAGTWLNQWAIGKNWIPLIADFSGDGKDDIGVVLTDSGDWQVAKSTGSSFSPVRPAFRPWAADLAMQPFAANFMGPGRAAICARNPFLRSGTADFAISVVDKMSAGASS